MVMTNELQTEQNETLRAMSKLMRYYFIENIGTVICMKGISLLFSKIDYFQGSVLGIQVLLTVKILCFQPLLRK